MKRAPRPDALDAGPAPPPRGRSGSRSLMILVAACATLLGAGRMIRDQFRPAVGNLRALRSADVDERRAAARGLWRLGPDEVRAAIPPLIEAAADQDLVVRQNALVALGRAVAAAGPDPASRFEVRAGVAVVVRALDAADSVSRDDAVAFLGQYLAEATGDPAVAAAALAHAALRHRWERTREGAADALFRGASRSTIAPPAELAATLAAYPPAPPWPQSGAGGPGRRAGLRGAAAVLLAGFPAGRPAAFAPLAAALDDPAFQVRRGGAMGLTLLDPAAIRPAVPRLLAILAEPVDPVGDWKEGLACRWFAPGIVEFADPIGRHPDPADLPSYETWDPAPMAALALARAAGAGPPDGRIPPALVGLLAAPQPWRRDAAAAALDGLGPGIAPAAPALVEALARATRRPGPPPGGGRSVVADLASVLGKAAAGTASAPAAVGLLVPLLDDPAWGAAADAAESLGALGPAAAPALPRLRVLARPGPGADDAADLLARAAGRAIRAIDPSESVPDRPDPGGTAP